MAHFAELNKDGVVLRIIVVNDQYEIDGENWCNKLLGGIWKQTSYNTSEGEHRKGKVQLRKNYAGIGYKYDIGRDAFIPSNGYPSFILNETKGIYEAPVVMPIDGKNYKWDEGSLSWKLNN